MRIPIPAIAALALLLAACSHAPQLSSATGQIGSTTDPNSIPGVAAFIRTADSILIFSISPKVFRRGAERALTPDELIKGGHGVYGSVVLEKSESAVLAEKFSDVFESSDRYFRCFDPRHAILARKGGSVCLVEICFECEHIYWTYAGGKRTFAGNPFRDFGDDLHVYLNSKLRAANVTLSSEVSDEP